MKKRIALVIAALLICTAVFVTGCGGNSGGGNSDTGDGSGAAITPGINFSVPDWLSDKDHEMQFQFIALNTPSGTTEATADQKDHILGLLKNVVFDAVQSPNDDVWDFAFAMNEPYLFFSFRTDSWFVKAPADNGYDDYAASIAAFPELNDLTDYINSIG